MHYRDVFLLTHYIIIYNTRKRSDRLKNGWLKQAYSHDHATYHSLKNSSMTSALLC